MGGRTRKLAKLTAELERLPERGIDECMEYLEQVPVREPSPEEARAIKESVEAFKNGEIVEFSPAELGRRGR